MDDRCEKLTGAPFVAGAGELKVGFGMDCDVEAEGSDVDVLLTTACEPSSVGYALLDCLHPIVKDFESGNRDY